MKIITGKSDLGAHAVTPWHNDVEHSTELQASTSPQGFHDFEIFRARWHQKNALDCKYSR